MSEANAPIFFDLDPETGQPVPTTFEAVLTALKRLHPISPNVPDPLREELLAAIDYIALAYEQANVGRPHLFERLTGDGFLAAIRALELALRDRLGRGNSATLERLVEQGIEAEILPASGRAPDVWDELRRGRNQVAHGRPERPAYGVAASRVVGFVIDAVDSMYGGARDGDSTRT